MMKLVDIKEIASMLSVKPSTLYQWAELGHIPCLKLNGCLRFDIDDVVNWVNSCKKDAESGYNPFVKSLSVAPGREDKKHGAI